MQIQQQYMQTQQASIGNLENQLEHFANALNDQLHGRLPSDTQVPRMEEGKQ